jgi:hypothetical protein
MCYNWLMEQSNTQPDVNTVSVAEESLDELIALARAEGNPWAEAAGIFPDDDLTQAWIEEMRDARRRADENPDF